MSLTNPSQGACTASGSKSAEDDDELDKMLEEAFEEPKPKDSVTRYHESIRRTLVDWGDEVIDAIAAKFPDEPKVLAHLHDVRKEMIDPLRKPL